MVVKSQLKKMYILQCFDANVFVAPYADTVKAGMTDSSFSGHLIFNDTVHVPGSFLVYYVFYDVQNPSDSSVLYVMYNTQKIVGISEHTNSNSFLSNPYPNPTHGLVSFDYKIKKNTTLEIRNAFGQIVKTLPLSASVQTTTLNTSSLPAGIYFCSFGLGARGRTMVIR